MCAPRRGADGDTVPRDDSLVSADLQDDPSLVAPAWQGTCLSADVLVSPRAAGDRLYVGRRGVAEGRPAGQPVGRDVPVRQTEGVLALRDFEIFAGPVGGVRKRAEEIEATDTLRLRCVVQIGVSCADVAVAGAGWGARSTTL